MAADGYHIIRPIEINCNQQITNLKVECCIDNDTLIAGVIMLVFSSMVRVISEILVAKLMSFVPVLYFLFMYYINRKEFIKNEAA